MRVILWKRDNGVIVASGDSVESLLDHFIAVGVMQRHLPVIIIVLLPTPFPDLWFGASSTNSYLIATQYFRVIKAL